MYILYMCVSMCVCECVCIVYTFVTAGENSNIFVQRWQKPNFQFLVCPLWQSYGNYVPPPLNSTGSHHYQMLPAQFHFNSQTDLAICKTKSECKFGNNSTKKEQEERKNRIRSNY